MPKIMEIAFPDVLFCRPVDMSTFFKSPYGIGS